MSQKTTEAAQIGYISPFDMFFVSLQSMSLVHFAASHTLVCNPPFVDKLGMLKKMGLHKKMSQHLFIPGSSS